LWIKSAEDALMPPLDFPATPALDDIFTDPVNGTEWRWDGTCWVGAGGGGTAPPFNPPTTGVGDVFMLQDQPTTNQPIIMGVTDGSNAVAGAVGEVLSRVTGYIAFPGGGIPITLATLNLTPGDWDVSGEAQTYMAPGVINGMQAMITTDESNGFLQQTRLDLSQLSLLEFVPFSGGVCVNLAPCRVNVAAATPVYLRVQPSSSTADPIQVQGKIMARRMR
jgi:hypothetical protein